MRVGGPKKKGGEGEGGKEVKVQVERKVGINTGTYKVTEHTRLVQKYSSCEDDVAWASRGLIGTVIDGTTIPLIQNRVEDAGFKDIDIIPLGADKVFVHSLSNIDMSEVVHEAKQFFDLIFSNLTGWTKILLPYQKGAWIRLYGIPLHAWNDFFFKLCVFDCGRYLKVDNCSLNRERFDYA